MTNKKNNEVIDPKYDEEYVRFIIPETCFSFTVSQIKYIKKASKYIRKYAENIDDDLLAAIDTVDNLLGKKRIMAALKAAKAGDRAIVEAGTSDRTAILEVLSYISIMYLSAHKTINCLNYISDITGTSKSDNAIKISVSCFNRMVTTMKNYPFEISCGDMEPGEGFTNEDALKRMLSHSYFESGYVYMSQLCLFGLLETFNIHAILYLTYTVSKKIREDLETF